MKILIATDNHIGYAEKDPVRGQDSLNTFEEILQIARDKSVDLILLGGDLFHDNKPSRHALHQTMTLLRKYCFGDRQLDLEFLSDASELFPYPYTCNYLDANYNVSIPVFSIHGNHDDPAGQGNLCALDLLSISGLVNYFGKQTVVDDIHIKPLLLKKKDTKVAIYGLGNIRDERLHRSFRDDKVKFYKPEDCDMAEQDGWFNLFVIHQNRAQHSAHNYIPSHFIKDWFDLVLWGHEHECLIEPEQPSDTFHITQPGSSIATSLSPGEVKAKHIGILTINEKSFDLEKIRLRTVRPFVMDAIVLSKLGFQRNDQRKIEAAIRDKLLEMIATAKQEWNSCNDGEFPKPLIRLKVDYSDGFTSFGPHRIASKFIDSIANPKDCIVFHRKKTAPIRRLTRDELDTMPEPLNKAQVQDFVMETLSHASLSLLPENAFAHAVGEYVTKDETTSIANFVEGTLGTTRKEIINITETIDLDTLNLDEQVSRIKNERKTKFEETGRLFSPKKKLENNIKAVKGKRAIQDVEGDEVEYAARSSSQTAPKRAKRVGSQANDTSAAAKKKAAPRARSKNTAAGTADAVDIDVMEIDGTREQDIQEVEHTVVESENLPTASSRSKTKVKQEPVEIISSDDEPKHRSAASVPASAAEQRATIVPDSDEDVSVVDPPKPTGKRKANASVKKTRQVKLEFGQTDSFSASMSARRKKK